MIAHRTIMKNVAAIIRDSAAVLNYCRQHFGRGLDIHVGAYPNGIPSVEDAPFLWIVPEGNGENAAKGEDEVFTVRMVLGAAVKGAGGEVVINNVISPRTEEANGLTVNGGNLIVEDLRDIIVGIIAAAQAGAPISAIRREENDISHFPLEWAEILIDYYEPADLAELVN